MLREALVRHTKDEQIRFLLSEVFLLKGEKDKSSEILDNLVRKYPHNSLYWLKLSAPALMILHQNMRDVDILRIGVEITRQWSI